MELSFWAASDVGRKREHNEDNFLIDKKLSLFVVADGMGGHASGEVASHIAVHEFRNAVETHRDVIDGFSRPEATVSTHPTLRGMKPTSMRMVAAANVNIAPDIHHETT